ncbi:MAG: hypothetical protein Q9182_003055 [Xanthomendoza sp. 2 TL-2023]
MNEHPGQHPNNSWHFVLLTHFECNAPRLDPHHFPFERTQALPMLQLVILADTMFIRVRTSTVTSTTGTASTTITFLPGNPPAPRERREEAALDEAGIEKRDNPADLSGIASSAISSGCECLNLPTPVSKTTKTSVKTTTTKVPAPTVTKTVYPCATPVPTLIPTVPFGKANQPPSIPGNGQNTLYGAGTKGETIEGCCNLCYFEVPNCINAFFYGYQGCVVQQPSEVIGTGPGVSAVCPNGQIAGLTYSRDTAPPFRSQGDIAGPCGQTYNNL